MITRIVLGAAVGLALATAASAQSYTAPGGIPASTAPGGFAGQWGWHPAPGPYGYLPHGYVVDDGYAIPAPRAYRGRWNGYAPY